MTELKWVFVFMFSMAVMFIGIPFTLAAIESYYIRINFPINDYVDEIKD